MLAAHSVGWLGWPSLSELHRHLHHHFHGGHFCSHIYLSILSPVLELEETGAVCFRRPASVRETVHSLSSNSSSNFQLAYPSAPK